MKAIYNLFDTLLKEYPSLSILITLILAIYIQYVIRINSKPDPNLPPMVPYIFPFFGSMVTYGMNPVKFLREQRKIYGDNFTFLMFGRKITHCLGPDGNNLVLNAKHTSVNAEEAYIGLTKPVFGPNVVYDCPNAVLMEQKRMVKYGLTNEYLKKYVSIIETETLDHIKKWNDQDSLCIFKEMSGLIIKTASHCLLGEEIRAQLDESFADLFHDLDRGFTPIHFLFNWLPLPSFWNRDKSHLKVRHFFMDVVKQRRDSNTKKEDMLNALMEGSYKNGTPLPDEQVACILIALLLAGQHTSSTTSTWALLYLATKPELIEELLEEQKQILGEELPPLTLESLKKLEKLDNVVRETLRIRPPLLELMRKVTKDVPITGTNYIVPKGHYIAAAPVVSALDEKHFENPDEFLPSRWNAVDKVAEDLLGEEADKRKDENTMDFGFGSVSTSSAKSAYLPFGGGRHRCIGDAFAYLQLKTIIATIVRKHKFKLNGKFPEVDYTNLVAIPFLPAKIDFERRK